MAIRELCLLEITCDAKGCSTRWRLPEGMLPTVRHSMELNGQRVGVDLCFECERKLREGRRIEFKPAMLKGAPQP